MRSETGDTARTFATLRIVGDRLVPEQVTRILKLTPNRAYAKGERYFAGERTGEVVGKTGVWFFSTDRVVASNDLADHLLFLVGLLGGASPAAVPLAKLHRLVAEKSLKVVVSCFWYGRFGGKPPAIPRPLSAFFGLVPAEIETDFDTDEEDTARRSA